MFKSLCCVECGLRKDHEFGFRSDGLFTLDEAGEADCVAMEAGGSETRRPSCGETAPHKCFDTPRLLTQRKEAAVQTEVSSHIFLMVILQVDIGEPAGSSSSFFSSLLIDEEHEGDFSLFEVMFWLSFSAPVPLIPKNFFLKNGRDDRVLNIG